ncbi:hypothetical protein GCM10009569_14840 [Arthrobacter russicus]
MQGFGAQAQFAAHRGKGDADHGNVQGVQGQDRAQDEQEHDLPTGPFAGGRGVWLRRRRGDERWCRGHGIKLYDASLNDKEKDDMEFNSSSW